MFMTHSFIKTKLTAHCSLFSVPLALFPMTSTLWSTFVLAPFTRDSARAKKTKIAKITFILLPQKVIPAKISARLHSAANTGNQCRR